MTHPSKPSGQPMSPSRIPVNDRPPRTFRLFGCNIPFSPKRFLVNSIPFFLLALWRFHFGQIYFWFPTHFASQYHPGWTCSTIQVPGGGMCEDVVEWKERGLAILTCDSNRRKWNTVMGPLADPNPKGQLVMVDYTQSPPTVKPLSLELPQGSDFHPLGAALFHQSRHSTLFITNAQRNGSTIEMFHVSHATPPILSWRRTISHPLIPNANAIHTVSSTSFYVTNDHRFRRAESTPIHTLESYLQLPLAWTTFVELSGDEVLARKVVSSQRVANGITATPDSKTIFIAESARGGFGVYTRTDDDELHFKEFVRVNGFTDNINFNDDGYVDDEHWGMSSITAGCHPNILRLEKFARGKQNAPSWIVSFRPEGMDGDPSDKGLYRAKNYKDTWQVKTELQDDGDWFGGATGAIIDHGRNVMIGTGLYDSNGAFICKKSQIVK